MKVTRTSMVSGTTRTMDLDITPEEKQKYDQGALIQDAFPRLNASEREFILTGITPEEWAQQFSGEDK